MSIEVKNYSKSFDNGKTYAIKDLSINIKQGEFIAIIGLSGAGKSTFLRAINGTNSPGAGTLSVLGKNVPELKTKELRSLRKKIGFIFQQFNLVKNITALQNVLVGRVAYAPMWRVLTGLYSLRDKYLAKNALDATGLQGRYNERASNLSGGQQQRVAIARALVQEPKIILADEPMASLDPKLSEVILDILQNINKERNITILVNIHVLELAKKYAKRIIAFRHGKLIFDDKPENLSSQKLESIYEVNKQELGEM